MKNLILIMSASVILHSAKADSYVPLYSFQYIGKFLDAITSYAEYHEQHLSQLYVTITQDDEDNQDHLYRIALTNHNTPVIEALGRISSTKAVNSLVVIVKGSNYYASSTALEVLSTMPTDLAVPGLIEVLSDETVRNHTRKMAIAYLSSHPSETAEISLHSQIMDTSVLPTVLSVLGDIGTTNSLMIISNLATTASGNVQSIAQHSQKRIISRTMGEEMLVPSVDASYDEIKMATNAVRASMRNGDNDGENRNIVYAMDENDSEENTVYYPSKSDAVLIPSDITFHVTAESEMLRSRAVHLGNKLAQIEQEAMQLEMVKASYEEYYNLLWARMNDIDPLVNSGVRDDIYISNIMEKSIIDGDVIRAGEKAQRIMLDAMVKINPHTIELLNELNETIAKFIQTQRTAELIIITK